VTLARNEHQMDRPSHGGAPCGARSVYAPVARDKAQGRPHVRPVCVASSLLAGSTRYLPVRTGGASRPVPFIHVTLRPPSTVERHRRLVSFLPMGRAATKFVAQLSGVRSRHRVSEHFDCQVTYRSERHHQSFSSAVGHEPTSSERTLTVAQKPGPSGAKSV
jgi:hypothetical protein